MAILDDYSCVCKKCKLKSVDKEFVAEGKKTRFILQNPNRKLVDKYIVDDCLLKSKQKEEKCDYLFNIKNDKVAYFIECKGSDILKAVDQINSTLTILRNAFLEYTLKGRIVSTKVYAPDMRTNNYRKLREKLNGNLETKNIVCIEVI